MGIFLVVMVVVGLIFVLGVFLALYSSRYKKVGPNEVLIISGRRHSAVDLVTGEKTVRNYRIVKGGGAFIWPVLERVDDLSLEIMTIDVVTPKVYTIQGVPITVDGVAQVKIRGDDISIATASEQVLSKSQDEIRNVALQTLEGHLRAILGTLTVEEVYKDRDAFAARVQDVAAGDLANMGLSIVSFTIKDIRDDQGYLDALGRKRTAEVKRDAGIPLEIVKRSDVTKGFKVLPKRWIVERMFGWLGRCRRLAKDFENTARTHAAFVMLAMIRVRLHRLARD